MIYCSDKACKHHSANERPDYTGRPHCTLLDIEIGRQSFFDNKVTEVSVCLSDERKSQEAE